MNEEFFGHVLAISNQDQGEYFEWINFFYGNFMLSEAFFITELIISKQNYPLKWPTSFPYQTKSIIFFLPLYDKILRLKLDIVSQYIEIQLKHIVN